MKFVDQFSERLAISIHQNADNPASVAVLKYSLSMALKMMIFIVAILVISLITGHFWEGAVACAAFFTLRYFSGGLHFRSEQVCNVVSTIMILIAIYTPVNYWYTGVVLNLIAFILLMIFAPSNMKKSKLQPKHYPVLKLIALLIVAGNFVVQAPVLATAFFLQAFTTIPTWQKIMDRNNW